MDRRYPHRATWDVGMSNRVGGDARLHEGQVQVSGALHGRHDERRGTGAGVRCPARSTRREQCLRRTEVLKSGTSSLILHTSSSEQIHLLLGLPQ